MNTNIIRFENINRIQIQIFWYSNIIRIIFQYRIIRSPLALKPVKAHYCAQRQNIKEYKRTIYFQKVQRGCIFYWSPPKTMIKSLQKVKVRVKTSHLIFG